MDFVTFRHKSNGAIANYPAHYADHPVFGFDLERYDAEAEPVKEAPVKKTAAKKSDVENNEDI